MAEFVDLAGMRFTRLTAVEPVRRAQRIWWRCSCDCGEETVVSRSDLRSGRTRSCGCLKSDSLRERRSRRHLGRASYLTNPHEYRSWSHAKGRCHNADDEDFRHYGGRGISMCDRWRFGEGDKTGFECFFEDVGPKPDNRLSIDRVDNNGNYEPGNVRWATQYEQVHNRRKAA